MIYTIVDLADVFADNSVPTISFKRTRNGFAEYVTLNGKQQIRRLISTVPSDYLNL